MAARKQQERELKKKDECRKRVAALKEGKEVMGYFKVKGGGKSKKPCKIVVKRVKMDEEIVKVCSAI